MSEVNAPKPPSAPKATGPTECEVFLLSYELRASAANYSLTETDKTAIHDFAGTANMNGDKFVSLSEFNAADKAQLSQNSIKFLTEIIKGEGHFSEVSDVYTCGKVAL